MTEEDFTGDFIAIAVFLAASLEIAVALYLMKRIGGAMQVKSLASSEQSQLETKNLCAIIIKLSFSPW